MAITTSSTLTTTFPDWSARKVVVGLKTHKHDLSMVIELCSNFRAAKKGFIFSFNEVDIPDCYVAHMELKQYHPHLLPAASAVLHMRSDTRMYAERLRASLRHWQAAPPVYDMHGHETYIARFVHVKPETIARHVTLKFDYYRLAKLGKTYYAVDFRDREEYVNVRDFERWFPDGVAMVRNAQLLGCTPEEVADVLNNAWNANNVPCAPSMENIDDIACAL